MKLKILNILWLQEKREKVKLNNSIIPIIKELERVYDALSLKFDLKYPRPIITIQSKGRQKQTLDWHWADKWEVGKKTISEINICAEELNKNPIETLVHEMVHYSNTCDKIEDCNSQQYHNKAFKVRAENYGLNVEKAGRWGWAFTSVSDKLKKMLEEIKPNETIFKLYRKEHLSITAPTKMKKYSCGCTTIRCATDLSAKCLKCNNEFEVKE
jgi:hypothetical protein